MLFGDGTLESLDADSLDMLKTSAPSQTIQPETAIVDALVAAKLSSSKREARQFLEDQAVSLNGQVVDDPKQVLAAGDFSGGLALLTRGKKNVCVLVLS